MFEKVIENGIQIKDYTIDDAKEQTLKSSNTINYQSD